MFLSHVSQNFDGMSDHDQDPHHLSFSQIWGISEKIQIFKTCDKNMVWDTRGACGEGVRGSLENPIFQIVWENAKIKIKTVPRAENSQPPTVSWRERMSGTRKFPHQGVLFRGAATF